MSARWLTEAQVATYQAKRAGGRPAGRMLASEPVARRAKYGNEPQIVDGLRMASKKEARRYRELGLLLKSGKILFLCRQVRFSLPGGIEYVADFLYANMGENFVCEDVKSPATAKNAAYRIKKKLMLSTYNIKIMET